MYKFPDFTIQNGDFFDFDIKQLSVKLKILFIMTCLIARPL
jgi:hypothetical protein